MSFSVTSQAFSLENLICAIRTTRGNLVCWTVILNHVQTVIKHRKIDCEGGKRRERGKNNTRAVLMDEEIQLRSKNIYQPIFHRCNKYIVRRWFNQVERNARSKRSDTEVFNSQPTIRRFPRNAQVHRLLIEKLLSLLSSCSTSCVVLCEMEGWRLRYLCFFARKNNWHEVPVGSEHFCVGLIVSGCVDAESLSIFIWIFTEDPSSSSSSLFRACTWTHTEQFMVSIHFMDEALLNLRWDNNNGPENLCNMWSIAINLAFRRSRTLLWYQECARDS